MSCCLFLCVRSWYWRENSGFLTKCIGSQRGDKLKSNTEALKRHLSLTWKSVFVLLKIGVCFQKLEFVLQNGGFVFKNVVERFNYCIVKLRFSNSDFRKQTP